MPFCVKVTYPKVFSNTFAPSSISLHIAISLGDLISAASVSTSLCVCVCVCVHCID